jgi:hypothetical protein
MTFELIEKKDQEIYDEMERAVVKFPLWPTDPLHAVAVIGEELGELNRAILQVIYEPGKATVDDVRMEAIQTAAMAIRFVRSLDKYKFNQGVQHRQINP